MIIRTMTPDDWPSVSRIYAAGIASGHATFASAVPTWEAWDAGHLDGGRFVAEIEGAVVGWVAFCAVSDRCVYDGVVEDSVYVDPSFVSKGIGRRLLETAIAWSESNGIWTIQAGIFPENEASVRLHKGCGFRIVGRRERLGRMDGQWRDVLLMERRSAVADC
jgi:phosphinothricin acetyltransferase